MPRYRRKTEAVISLACLALLAFQGQTEARTRMTRRNRSLPGPLQALIATRAAIHTVAAFPIRAVHHRAQEPIYEAQLADRPAFSNQPLEVAYYTTHLDRPRAPQAEQVESFDEDEEQELPRTAAAEERGVVNGPRASLRNGVAHSPAQAPAAVKNAIRAANSIRHKPYVWGGGHGTFNDRGYDCSGTVSFALHHAGVLASPLPSCDLARFGERGRGRWITIYTRPGHTFAVIAGLRLDTTDFRRGGNVGPRWHTDMRDTFGYVARHPVGL